MTSEVWTKRQTLPALFLGIAILNSLIFAFLAFAGLFTELFSLHANAQVMVVFGIFNSLFAVLAIAVFIFKRWAVYALVILGVLYFMIYILFVGSHAPYFLRLSPVGYALFTGLYVLRHKPLFQ